MANISDSDYLQEVTGGHLVDFQRYAMTHVELISVCIIRQVSGKSEHTQLTTGYLHTGMLSSNKLYYTNRMRGMGTKWIAEGRYTPHQATYTRVRYPHTNSITRTG